MDLSWPKAESVNSSINLDVCLGTPFDILNCRRHYVLKKIGPGAHIYKNYISCSFRHIKIDCTDYDLMDLNWRDIAYIDTCLAFVTCHG